MSKKKTKKSAEQLENERVEREAQEERERQEEELRREVALSAMKVVLNGGTNEMDSATVPIKVGFDEQWLMDEDNTPTHILVIEQTKDETENVYHSMTMGRRSLYDLKQVVHFMQVFSPGYHRLAVVALDGKRCSKRFMENLLRDDHFSRSSNSISFSNLEEGDLSDFDGRALACKVMEFEVPTELFAQRPKTKFASRLWDWANWLHPGNPRDECVYRQRKMLAYSLKPFVGLGYLIIVYLIGGTFHSLYVLLASIATAFCGFRPRPVLREMYLGFMHERDEKEWSVCLDSTPEFLLWKRGKKEGEADKYLRVAPIEVLSVVVFLVGAYYLFKLVLAGELWWMLSALLWVLSPLLAVLGIMIVMVMLGRVPGKIGQTMTALDDRISGAIQGVINGVFERFESDKLSRAEQYKLWLQENMVADRMGEKVDLGNMPDAFGGTGRKVVQRFRLSFYGAKAKVCRPFQR